MSGALFPDCMQPDDCECRKRGYEHEADSCRIPVVARAITDLLRPPHQQTELEFLEDLNALISETLEGPKNPDDPWEALKALASEIRDRIADLEE